MESVSLKTEIKTTASGLCTPLVGQSFRNGSSDKIENEEEALRTEDEDASCLEIAKISLGDTFLAEQATEYADGRCAPRFDRRVGECFHASSRALGRMTGERRFSGKSFMTDRAVKIGVLRFSPDGDGLLVGDDEPLRFWIRFGQDLRTL